MALNNGKHLKRIRMEIENVSPLDIGGNDGEPLIDNEENKVYLPGTIIAGAFRSYLSSIGVNCVNDMFGDNKSDNSLSKVFVYDSYSDLLGIEIRPGIRIDKVSGASVSGGKFERYYVCSGHKFIINVEIYGENKEQSEKYGKNIYLAAAALNRGNIAFGSYKTGGAGIFKVNSLEEVNYDFTNKNDLFGYLKNSKQYEKLDIEKIFSENLQNDIFVKYELRGQIDTPLLVMGNSDLDFKRADSEQFKDLKGNYIVPGTSLKGIIRSQGEKILKYYKKENDIEKIFGSESNTESKIPSRFTAYDSKIENGKKVIYSKIKIDRFTGGVLKGQKMSEEPVVGGIILSGKLKIDKSLKNDKAIGLIALVFRDIARGEITIGSGESTGKGRIKGEELKVSIGNNILFKWKNGNENAETNKIDNYITAIWEE